MAKATMPSTKIPSVSGCKNLSAINFEPTAKPKKMVTVLIKAQNLFKSQTPSCYHHCQ
jgi:hypothetical protein